MRQKCPNCHAEQICRVRDFSEQAWKFLEKWGDIEKNVINSAVCEDCYQELREVLIDKATEIENLDKNTDSRVSVNMDKKTKLAG